MAFYTDADGTGSSMFDDEDHSGHVGGWHHLAATWDASTRARAIYVDGVLTASDANGPTTPYYDGAPTRIGGDTNSGALVLPFDGLIDEVKVFGCAADETAIARDHADGWPW